MKAKYLTTGDLMDMTDKLQGKRREVQRRSWSKKVNHEKSADVIVLGKPRKG